MAAAAAAFVAAQPSLLRLVRSRPTLAIGLAIIVAIAVLALLAPWVAPYSPSRLSIANRLKPPSAAYWFGTDEFGRDVFSRAIFAGRVSLLVGFAVVVVSSLIGVDARPGRRLLQAAGHAAWRG